VQRADKVLKMEAVCSSETGVSMYNLETRLSFVQCDIISIIPSRQQSHILNIY
jgi:hypothetical protein